MSADEKISQILTWLDEADPDRRIEIALDLPELDWVQIENFQDQGELIRLVYRAGFPPSAPADLLCDRAAVRAVRLRNRSVFDRLGDAESHGNRGTVEPA